MVEKKLTPAELTRLSLRVTLLVFNRGLTNLPKDVLPLELVEELKSGIRDAHDFLISGAQTKVVATIVASRLTRLLDSDFKPFTLYTQAFLTNRHAKRQRKHRIPNEQDGNVIEFPTSAGAYLKSENILHRAAEDRRGLYWSAVSEIERLADHSHRISGKPQKLFSSAKDFAYEGEKFVKNATFSDGELRWNNPHPPMEWETPISSEGEFIRRYSDALSLLVKFGICPGRPLPADLPPTEGSSLSRPRKRKAPTERKS